MKLGRNEPCHCGSGRKYKHCHYTEDQTAASAALREAVAVADTEPADAEPAESELEAASDPSKDSARQRKAYEPGHKHGGSRFLRDTSSAGGGRRGGGSRSSGGKSAGSTARVNRGSQRGS